jgi:enterochelin esterase-like enzyme
MNYDFNKILTNAVRRYFVLVLLAALVFHAWTAIAKGDSSGNDAVVTGQTMTIKLFTNLLRPLQPQNYERELVIYLPAEYVNDPTKTGRFPVIYLLHGSPGTPNDFSKNGHWQILLEQSAKQEGFKPPILVAPNGNYTAAAFGDSEWLNSADGQNRFEDFIVHQVVPYIDQHYRTLATPRSRVIGGVSEGGYGAVNIALHNPGVFGNVMALSGYYVNDGSGWARKTMGHNKDFLSYNSPLSVLNDPVDVAKWLSDWQTQRYFVASGLSENRYTLESQELVEELRDHHISAELFQVEGKHGWALWNALFVAGIKNIFAGGTDTAGAGATVSRTTQR